MADIASLAILLKLDDQASAGLRKVQGSLGDTAQSLGGLSASAVAMGAGVAAGAAVAVTALKGMAEAAAEVQYSVASIRTIKPEIDTGEVTKALKDLSTTVPQTAKQLGDSLYDVFSSINVSQAEGLALVEKFAKGATAAQTDAQTFGTAVVGVMNAYKLSVADADRISDIFFNTVRDGVVTGRELALSLGPVTQAAKAAGASVEELGAFIVGVTKEGGPAAQNINNLANLFAKINTQDAIKELNALGVAVADASGKLRSPLAVLTDLKTALADMTEAGRLNAIQQIFPDFQARQGAQTIMSQLDAVNAALAANRTEVGSTAQAYNIMADTAVNQTQLLQNAWTALSADVGAVLTPALTSIVSGLGDVVTGMRAAGDAAKPEADKIGAALDQIATQIRTAAIPAWQAYWDAARGPRRGPGDNPLQTRTDELFGDFFSWLGTQGARGSKAFGDLAKDWWEGYARGFELQAEINQATAQQAVAKSLAPTPALYATITSHAQDIVDQYVRAYNDAFKGADTGSAVGLALENARAALAERFPQLAAEFPALFEQIIMDMRGQAQLMRTAGREAAEGLADGLTAPLPGVEARYAALLANLGKQAANLPELLKAAGGDREVLERILRTENAQKAYTETLRGLNVEQQAYAISLKNRLGVEDALNQLVKDGYLTQDQLTRALGEGASVSRQAAAATQAQAAAHTAAADAASAQAQAERDLAAATAATAAAAAEAARVAGQTFSTSTTARGLGTGIDMSGGGLGGFTTAAFGSLGLGSLLGGLYGGPQTLGPGPPPQRTTSALGYGPSADLTAWLNLLDEREMARRLGHWPGPGEPGYRWGGTKMGGPRMFSSSGLTGGGEGPSFLSLGGAGGGDGAELTSSITQATTALRAFLDVQQAVQRVTAMQAPALDQTASAFDAYRASVQATTQDLRSFGMAAGVGYGNVGNAEYLAQLLAISGGGNYHGWGLVGSGTGGGGNPYYPSYQTGGTVGHTGLALLHAGETVLPASHAPAPAPVTVVMSTPAALITPTSALELEATAAKLAPLVADRLQRLGRLGYL